ncbi:sensor histidine kinase [Mucilaginibacter celer]|uniref:Sensor histidine kinase n=1 Tax=Mucilaginibacter celer TaxID=2305508 RepID=A0A494VNG6_9SPHI|nr:sensor histidine kinase [Mucilaginibacter celer]AYL96224.1 sensor histidine kinase [Mucilaginibacter celer]
MQVSSTQIEQLAILITAVFILAPITLILLVSQYNQRKRKHADETIRMKQNFDTEISRVRVEVHEQTLETVGADLHDHIGQLLSLTNLTLKSINEQNPEKTREKIDSAISLTSKSIQELRLLGKLLQGEQMLKDGLINSVKNEIKWLQKSETVTVEILCPEQEALPGLDANSELMIFRIFQESVNNIIKHAEATIIMISIECSEDLLTLKISDDGCGFDVEEKTNASGHMGISNILNRAELICGTAEILSIPGKGTTVTIKVPYKNNNEHINH